MKTINRFGLLFVLVFTFVLSMPIKADVPSIEAIVKGTVTLNEGKTRHFYGSYGGGSAITIFEKTAHGDKHSYHYLIPLDSDILEAPANVLKKIIIRSGAIRASSGSVETSFSIKKLVITKQGKKATVRGSFGEGSANGRFLLNFKYQ